MNKALDFDKSINYFGKSGQTKYFHIVKKKPYILKYTLIGMS